MCVCAYACVRACVLTGAGDLMVFTGVVVMLGVRVVEDGPALIVLHGVTVAAVVDLAAPTHTHAHAHAHAHTHTHTHTQPSSTQ